jgi:hypothetical protein
LGAVIRADTEVPVTASTVHNTVDHADFADEQACRLIETELGGRVIDGPAEPDGHRTVCPRPARRVDGDNTMEA